ncbi:hypothetical protein EVJ58_g7263 [Rhodofomes roseus]|uniref:DNA 3'-5' helicase n=1 Tax=Rhodofomes roseus TaxID=34475 RepID=A0A4Y9Y4K6_9APHY|nr:hypothetical protein EVJ58_g7263 [Rhodofomes roseus]
MSSSIVTCAVPGCASVLMDQDALQMHMDSEHQDINKTSTGKAVEGKTVTRSSPYPKTKPASVPAENAKTKRIAKILNYQDPCSPHTSYLISTPFLDSIGFVHHTYFKTLHCLACQIAYLPANALGHASSQHDLKNEDGAALMAALVEEHELVTHEDDVISPMPFGPPVEALVIEDGFKCVRCNKAGKSAKTLANHFPQEHKGDDTPTKNRTIVTKVQTFMRPQPLRYFAVTESLSQVDQLSPYAVFMHDVYPAIPAPFAPLSMDKNDVDPLVLMTRWNIHLQPFLQSRPSIESLVSLAQIPDKNDPIFGGLHAHVIEYMKVTRALADGAQFLILRMLDCYPLEPQGSWKPHSNDDTLRNYAVPVTAFITAVLRSCHAHVSQYQFPLSPSQIGLVEKLYSALKDNSPITSIMIHTLLYNLVAIPADGSDLNQWKCPLVCWLAVSGLRDGGRFMPAYDYTRVLAKWEYQLRNLHLYQAIQRATEYEDNLLGSVRHQCSTYLVDGSMTPWNSLRDHQRYASSLVLRQAAPAKIDWSDDMSKISCLGTTLELSRLRTGLQKICSSVKSRMEKLCNGNLLPISVPADLTEDLTDIRPGFSWLKQGPFMEPKLGLLEVLFTHPDYSLATVDQFGVFRWNHQGLRKLRGDIAALTEELAVLCFMTPAPPPRGTEFVDTRLSNAQIPRNVHKSFGTWFIHQRTKTSSLTESLSWVPTLCPDLVAGLLDFFLVAVRPLECVVAHALDGPSGQAKHEEFVWMANGKQYDSEQFSHILQRITSAHMGVGLSLHIWRHIAVSLMREFIPPTSIQDNFGDKTMNHNTNMARRIYAREVGHLPSLTTDAMLESRRFCEMWHDVLGVGKSPCPVPLRATNYQQHAHLTGNHPAAPAAPAVDVAQLTALVSASVNTSFEALKVHLEDLIQKAVVNGVSVAMRSLSQEGPPLRQPPVPQFTPCPRPYSPGLPDSSASKPANTSELTYSVDQRDPFKPSSDEEQETQGSMEVDSQPLSSAPSYLQYSTPVHYDAPNPSHRPTYMTGSAAEDTAFVGVSIARDLLRQGLNNPHASFISHAQYELVACSLARDRNVIGILPTGGGKSMCYELPALLYRDQLSIVFVPFVSLIQDQIRRASERGVKAAKFSQTSDPAKDLQILFVSWEHAADQRLHNFIQSIRKNVSYFRGLK